jgi:hypothetical protein
MPSEIPTKPPAAPTAKDPNKSANKSFDRFHPEMPNIPGVDSARLPARAASNDSNPQRLVMILTGAVAVVAIVAAIFWWVKASERNAVNFDSAEPALAEPAALQPTSPTPADPANARPAADLTVDQLPRPWTAKKFVYVKPLTHEKIDAMVIRLPGGGLWAFAVQEPYGKCDLEFVTDIAQLAAKYGYHATHPMVVNPCNNTVYDPLKIGPLGGSTWARGEIVQGSGLRPPLSIDIVVKGHSVIADRME